MKPVSWPLVIGVAVIATIVGAVLSGTLVVLGHNPLILTPWLALFFLVVAGFLLWGGIGVKRLKTGAPTRISPLQAARIAALARSSLINGAGFTGFLAGTALIGVMRLWAPAMLSASLGSGVAALGALLLTVIAAIVEHWCIDDSPEQDSSSRKVGA